MTIGERIRELRDGLNMSQSELAKRIHTTKQTIYKYENNIVTNIPSSKIEKLADTLNSTPAYLMGWTSDEEDLVSHFDFIEYAKSIGYFIVPYEPGECNGISKEVNGDETSLVIGCEDNLCVTCPKFIRSYKLTHKDKAIVIDFERYNIIKNEVLSFTRFKMGELFKEDTNN